MRRTSVTSNTTALPEHLRNNPSEASGAESVPLPLPVLPPPPNAPSVGLVLPRSIFDRGLASPSPVESVFGVNAALAAQKKLRAHKRRPRRTRDPTPVEPEEGEAVDVEDMDGREQPGDRQSRMEEEVAAARGPGCCSHAVGGC